MADRRTKTRMKESTEPQFLESFQVPMGDIRHVPLNKDHPFHAYAYTDKDPVFMGAYPTMAQARERIMEYAAAVVSCLFLSSQYRETLAQFSAEG